MSGFRSYFASFIVVLLLISTIGASATAQESPDTSAGGGALFSADGIDSAILAQADLADADAGATLLLELLEVAPDNELPLHQTTSPELFYVLAGVVTFRDNFGFASVVDGGRVVSLNPGTEYTIANTESDAGRVLRLRLVGGTAATPGATPAAGGGGGDGTTVLMQTPLEGSGQDGARMYLGRAQFGPNADSGEQGHAGPLGIYVDSGTLNVVSPSGLVGAIEAGRAVSLPAATPLHASTGESEAVVFLAGIASTEGEPFAPMSSGVSVTEPGTVLESGQIWRTGTVEMAVDFVREDSKMRFAVTYINTSDSTRDFRRTAGGVFVRDDDGGTWRIPSSDCPYRERLEPGDSIACTYTYYPPRDIRPGSIVVSFNARSFGEVNGASWQMELNW